MDTQPVIIAGAGIAGLSIAYALQKKGIPYKILEAANHPGGVLCSLQQDGYQLDAGPNTIAATPATMEFIKEIGLEDEVMEATAVSKKRFLVRNNQLHAVSPHPLKIIRSNYISAGAKWRLFTEQFKSKAIKVPAETVTQFVTRRFGKEINDYLFDPVLSGIYAGNPDLLSVHEVLPMLRKWEYEYGSVTKGLMKNKEVMGGRKIIAFKQGNAELGNKLASLLDSPVRYGCAITGITRGASDYIVQYTEHGQTSMFNANKIILTTPAYATAGIINTLDAKLGADLQKIHYPRMGVLHLGFGAEALQNTPEGFGFLVPNAEGKHFLGAICNSAIFPSRAPSGKILFTVFMGGARHEHFFNELGVDRWKELVIKELMSILKLKTPPEMQHFAEWEKAIPQFNLDSMDYRFSVKEFTAEHPGIQLAGNYISGVAVPAIIQAAQAY
jgi:protoporphyrinogen/coproporphyrinogen III oxidase